MAPDDPCFAWRCALNLWLSADHWDLYGGRGKRVVCRSHEWSHGRCGSFLLENLSPKPYAAFSAYLSFEGEALQLNQQLLPTDATHLTPQAEQTSNLTSAGLQHHPEDDQKVYRSFGPIGVR
ncbi:Hypothetical predicted protein [Podarcis lilfordi]|uniref:Uncharacterized protein n=1 Tax=Podarcis lilfordi TaxID=74358 RepID=A0AA35KS68_9SAUR|nr:Hypothetical predicted protein [Podarcis lilfordi]